MQRRSGQRLTGRRSARPPGRGRDLTSPVPAHLASPNRARKAQPPDTPSEPANFTEYVARLRESNTDSPEDIRLDDWMRTRDRQREKRIMTSADNLTLKAAVLMDKARDLQRTKGMLA